jgi:hypothetical protein
MTMNHEEERLRAALRRMAPDPDENAALQRVMREGRSQRTRRQVLRGGGVILVLALLALAGFGAFRLVRYLDTTGGQTLPIAGSSESPLVSEPTTSPPPSDTELVSSTTTSSSTTSSSTTTMQPAGTVIYRNDQFGFSFTLPASWEGYQIVTLQWEGFPNNGGGNGTPDTPVYGPQIDIRHPLWTQANPRQDIPIMIFTAAQWEQVQQETLGVSAAPIPPTELGHNSTYVFALPARYNYAFPTGYQEVENILAGHPLQGFEPTPTTG